LLGQYVASDFLLSTDGHGGSLVTDSLVSASVNAADALAGAHHG